MSSHTPGPWYIDPDGMICDQADTVLCDPHYDSRDIEEREANACLIAAAPELAEALRNLLASMEAPRTRKATVAVDAAYAALKKAGL